MVKTSVAFTSLLRLLILTGIFNVLDFFFTQDLVVYGVHGEWNPLMRGLVGTPYFAIYKLVLIPLGLLILWLARETVAPKYIRLVRLTCGVYALLMLYTCIVFYS